MNRSSPLKRKARLSPKRKKPRRSGRVRDTFYLAWLHTLPCYMAELAKLFPMIAGPCGGPIEADHAGPRPYGRKCSDREAVSLCRDHHRQRTDYRGWWRDMVASDMRKWADEAIAYTQSLWERAKERAKTTDIPF